MYNIYLVTKVFFVFTKNKEFQTTSTVKIILSLFHINACSWLKRKSHPAFFPADVSVNLHSSVRGVSGCLEKYVLVEGLAKLARPNMDIVDVLFFSSPGSQTRPWSMQWFPYRCFVSHSCCTLASTVTSKTFVRLFRIGFRWRLVLRFCCSATGDESDVNLSVTFSFLQVMQNSFDSDADPLCLLGAQGGQSVLKDG